MQLGSGQPDLPLPPPPVTAKPSALAKASVAAQPSTAAPVTRKRKSRWEDAPTATNPPSSNITSAAAADSPQPALLSAMLNAASLPNSGAAEVSLSHANSLPAAPPQAELKPSGSLPQLGGSLPQLSGSLPQLSGSLPQLSSSLPQSVALFQPPVPSEQSPQAASAKQTGEAQAAAALSAVEQMLQSRRERNQAPASTARSAQPPLPTAAAQQPPPPQAQPPLPPMPPPLAPQPAFQPAQPNYPFSAALPSTPTGQMSAAGLGRPPLGAAHMHGLPGWPHMAMPHMGHMQPHQHVQAGLQQHHVPAPMHHLPSMLQQQRWPQLHGISQPMAPPQPPQPPQPPAPPQWGSPMQHSVHRGFQQAANGPARPPAPQAANGPANGPAKAAANGIVRETAPQAPKWAPDAHFQDFPHTEEDATPMPTDVDSAFKLRHSTTVSTASAVASDSAAANGVPAAPPSPPPEPPASPPAPPSAPAPPTDAAQAPVEVAVQDAAAMNGTAPPPAGQVEQAPAVALDSSTIAAEGGATDPNAGGSAESRSNSPLPDHVPSGESLWQIFLVKCTTPATTGVLMCR